MSSPLYLAIDHPHLDAAQTLAQKCGTMSAG